MAELLVLADRVEKLTGGDRRVDAEIFKTLGMPLPTQFLDCGISLIWDDPQQAFIIPIGEMQMRYEHPHFTASLDAVLTLLPEGFWWRGGTCSVSSEATVCPDHNGPHRERLLRECPPTELIWDEGIETELRPGSNNALIRALLSAILRARQAMQMEASS